MKWFFLTGESLVKMLLITLVVINLLPWYLSSAWILVFCSTLFLFRKNKVFYKDNFALNHDLMLSPVSGRVLSARQVQLDNGETVLIIRLMIPLHGPFGLFLPFDSSVEALETFKGAALWRWRKEARFTKGLNRYNLTLQNKSGEKVVFGLIKGQLGFEPRLYVQPGDKGKGLACFGYFPLGGSLNITLPSNAKAMVSAGDKVKAGETALVGF